MTTDGMSTEFLRFIADRVNVKLQGTVISPPDSDLKILVFQIRNDSRSGGTIGPMTSARLGVRAIDVGIPQLSMHSIRATTGSKDVEYGLQLYQGVYKYFETASERFKDAFGH